MNIDVGEVIKALDNPTRLAIMNWLKDPRHHFPEQEIDPAEIGVCVSIIQAKANLSQSTVSIYLSLLLRAKLVTSQRVGPWTYYKRNEESIEQFKSSIDTLL